MIFCKFIYDPRSCFVVNMAEERNFVDCDTACGNGCPWENRKCNIALITGITGQVNTVIDVSCHNRYVRDTPEMHFTDYYYSGHVVRRHPSTQRSQISVR